MRKRLEERIARLEGSFQTPQPATPSKGCDLSKIFDNVETASARRKRWLAIATTTQLEARLRRLDGVEEAEQRRAERHIRDGVRWAGLFDTEGFADSDREEIAQRLLGDAGIEIIYPDLRELVKKAREAPVSGSIAGTILATVAKRRDAHVKH